MAGGIHGVRGHAPSSRASFSAVGGSAPAGGPSLPESAADYCGLCKALAERGPLLTEDERAAFNAMRAREMAKAEARRRPESPQGDLLDIAA